MNRRGVPPLLRRRALGRRHPNMYAVMLFIQLFDRIASLDPKPPITLLLIFLNLGIFYFPTVAPFLPPAAVSILTPVIRRLAVRKACLNPTAILSGQRARLLLSSFIHLSDIHVLFNCTSFLYKGVTLEASLGSFVFLLLIVYLAISAHVLYVAIAVILRSYGHPSLMSNCVAGFSGVLFGLKVIVNADPRHARAATNIFGIPLPGGAAPWTELIMASALMPNVSFLGHLCGIFAGLIYVFVPKFLTSFVFPLFRTSLFRRAQTQRFQGRPRYLNEHEHAE